MIITNVLLILVVKKVVAHTRILIAMRILNARKKYVSLPLVALIPVFLVITKMNVPLTLVTVLLVVYKNLLLMIVVILLMDPLMSILTVMMIRLVMMKLLYFRNL